MNRQELRALMAAILRSQLVPQTPDDTIPTPWQKTHYAVDQADALLAELERTATPEPSQDATDLAAYRDGYRTGLDHGRFEMRFKRASAPVCPECDGASVNWPIPCERCGVSHLPGEHPVALESTATAEAQVDRLAQEVERLRREVDYHSGERLAAQAKAEEWRKKYQATENSREERIEGYAQAHVEALRDELEQAHQKQRDTRRMERKLAAWGPLVKAVKRLVKNWEYNGPAEDWNDKQNAFAYEAIGRAVDRIKRLEAEGVL